MPARFTDDLRLVDPESALDCAGIWTGLSAGNGDGGACGSASRHPSSGILQLRSRCDGGDGGGVSGPMEIPIGVTGLRLPGESLLFGRGS